MGYYLEMENKRENKRFNDLGGKFFGYLEDEEYKECVSAKFVAAIDIETYAMLNVFWACVSFELNSIAAELFLKLYREDVLRFKQNPDLVSLDKAIEYVRTEPYQYFKFSLG